LYIGCDILVAASSAYLDVTNPSRTIAIVSTSEVPTGDIIVDKDASFPDQSLTTGRILSSCDTDRREFLDSRRITLDLFDDDQFANVFLVGMAYQTGSIPVSAASIEEAISLNGVAVERNIQAFRRGRQALCDRDSLTAVINDLRDGEVPERSHTPKLRQLRQ